MNNKLIKLNKMKALANNRVFINADFTLGNIDLVVSQGELERLMNGGNMDRLTKDKYKQGVNK